jgi:hypothetical protein
MMLFVGGADGCSSRDHEQEKNATTMSGDTLICGYTEVAYSGGPMRHEPSYFIVPAMNRKLKYYPELASAVGLESVTDCESARRFYWGYRSYRREHPGFDRNQPLEPLPAPRKLSPRRLPVGSASKIFNGAAGDLLPVVRVSYTISGDWGYWDDAGPDGGDSQIEHGETSCSGAFIAKNWILTAAHCLRDIALHYAPDPDETNTWVTEHQWTIEWAVKDSQGETRSLTTNLVAIPSPSYLGVDYANGHFGGPSPAFLSPPTEGTFANDDIALLYVNPDDDSNLPSVNLPDMQNPLQYPLYVSTQKPQIGWQLIDYGYGPTSESGFEFGHHESQGPIGTLSISNAGDAATSEVRDDGVIAQVFKQADLASLCHGDSGGPLVRDVGLGSVAIVGVNAAFHRSTDGGGSQKCASVVGDTNFWISVDQQREFIEGTLRKFYSPAFSCLDLPDDVGNLQNTMMRCWGTPCFSDCDCPSGKFCSNPSVSNPANPARTTGCPICGSGFLSSFSKQSCDCEIGQCLPANIFGTGETASDAACADQ